MKFHLKINAEFQKCLFLGVFIYLHSGIYMYTHTHTHKSGVLQRTVYIHKIMMLQRTRRTTIGRRSTRVRMTCRAFPL